jgi:hypothetical protein
VLLTSDAEDAIHLRRTKQCTARREEWEKAHNLVCQTSASSSL